MSNIRIDIEDVLKNFEIKKKINKPELDNIDFYYKNNKINIPKKIIDDWKFIGLINTDFVVMNYDYLITLKQNEIKRTPVRKIENYRYIGDIIEIKVLCYDSWCKEPHSFNTDFDFDGDIKFTCSKCGRHLIIPNEMIKNINY